MRLKNPGGIEGAIATVKQVRDQLGSALTRDRQQKANAKEVLRAMWALHGTAPNAPAALLQATDVTIEIYLDGDWHKRHDNSDGEIIAGPGAEGD